MTLQAMADALMRDVLERFLSALLLLVLAPVASKAQTFMGLGPGSRIATTFVVPISHDGSAVVGWIEDGDSTEAFRWTAHEGVERLGFLTGPIGETPGSAALGVSADGSGVIGNSNGEAFRWTSSQGMVGLGFLPPRADFQVGSAAHAVSGDGSAVVGSSYGEAFRWSEQSGIVGLGLMGCCNFQRSSAFFISSNGSTASGIWNADLLGGTFRWVQGQGMGNLGSLVGALSTLPQDMSPDGSAVVGHSGDRAFRWTAQTGMRELEGLEFVRAVSADGSVAVGGANGRAVRWTEVRGVWDLGGSPVFGIATDVADDGSIVAGTHQTSGSVGATPQEPFLWDRANGTQSLISMLAGLGVDVTDWVLSRPGEPGRESFVRLSGDGRAIAGNGVNPDGMREAWVVTLDCAGDADCDAVPDPADNCPVLRTPDTSDVDQNGVGDECECGDQNRDGRVDVSDLIEISGAIFDPSRVTPLCDTNDDDLCDVRDIVGANLRIFGAPAHCSRNPTPRAVL